MRDDGTVMGQLYVLTSARHPMCTGIHQIEPNLYILEMTTGTLYTLR